MYVYVCFYILWIQRHGMAIKVNGAKNKSLLYTYSRSSLHTPHFSIGWVNLYEYKIITHVWLQDFISLRPMRKWTKGFSQVLRASTSTKLLIKQVCDDNFDSCVILRFIWDNTIRLGLLHTHTDSYLEFIFFFFLV